MTAVSQYLSCPWIKTGIVSANMSIVDNYGCSFVRISPSLWLQIFIVSVFPDIVISDWLIY